MKGTQHEVVVESLANSGDGVGRIDGIVVFIPFSAPGDRVLVEIVQSKKHFLKAKIVKVLSPSPQREEPRCPHFGVCGGCDWQHIPYPQQLEWKRVNLVDTLKRIGGIDTDALVMPTHPSPKTFGYRNRIQIHVDRGGPHYFAKGSKKVVPIKQCPLASDTINEWMVKNQHTLTGKKRKIELAESLSGGIDTFLVNEVGQSELGFRQVNDEQNNWIAERINSFIQSENIQSVVDLYCGQGNWSRSISQLNTEVRCLGIDNNPKNIEIAQLNSPANTEFILGDVGALIDKWQGRADLIIVDPPRAGCSEETLKQLNKETSHWLIYISCHPATLSRDLSELLKDKWLLEKVIPVDMFPQTAHLECLTILRSANGAKAAKY